VKRGDLVKYDKWILEVPDPCSYGIIIDIRSNESFGETFLIHWQSPRCPSTWEFERDLVMINENR